MKRKEGKFVTAGVSSCPGAKTPKPSPFTLHTSAFILPPSFLLLLLVLFSGGCASSTKKDDSSPKEVSMAGTGGETRPEIRKKQPDSPPSPKETIPTKHLTETFHMECIFCHENPGEKELHSFIKKESAKINPYTQQPLTRTEVICTSCHDFFHYIHPEGVPPQTGRTALPRDIRLEEGKITCLTCHCVHQEESSYKSLYWSVESENQIKDFCVNCHDDTNKLQDDVYYMLTELKILAMQKRKVFLNKSEDSWLSEGPVFIKRFYESMKGERYDEIEREEEFFLIQKYTGLALNAISWNDPDRAIHLLWSLFRKKSDYAEAYTQLAKGLESIGNTGQAEKFYLRALEKDNTYAQAYFRLGRILHRRKRYMEAIDLYSDAVKYDFQMSEAYYEMGECFLLVKNYSQGIKAFKKVVNLDPKNIDGYLKLARTYQLNGDYIDAVRVLDDAVIIYPDNFAIHFRMGNAYYAKSDMARAIASYRKALTLKPNDPETYTRLGRTFEVVRKMDEAISNYKSAIKTGKNNMEAYLHQARLLRNLNRFREAEEVYRSAILIQPDSMEAHLALGDAYYHDRNYSQAEQEYKTAISLEPHTMEAQLRLGRVYLKSGQVEKAIDALQNIVNEKTDRAEVYLLLGECMRQKGNIEKAIRIYRKGLRYTPEQTVLSFNLGYLYWKKLHRFKQAREAFETAVASYPTYDKAYLYMALMAKEENNIPRAIEFLEKTIKLNSNRIEAYLILAKLIKGQEQYSRADRIFSEGVNRRLSDFRDNSWAAHSEYELDAIDGVEREKFYNKLGIIYMANGKWDNAAEAFSRVLKHNPAHPHALTNLILACKAQSRPDKARGKLTGLLNIYPRNQEIYLALGNVHRKMGKKKLALKNYLQARELTPRNSKTADKINTALAEVYEELKRYKNDKELLASGDEHYKKKDYAQAEQEYKMIISIDPRNPEARLRLGRLYYKTDRIDKAISTLREITGEKHNRAEIYLLLGKYLIQTGNIDEAIRIYRQGLDNCTEQAVLCFNIGYVYWKKLHRNDRARKMLVQATAVYPEYDKAYFYLGQILKSEKDLTRATRFLQKSLQLNPNRIDAYLLLAEMAETRQQYSRAERIFSEGLNRPIADSGELSQAPHAQYELDIQNHREREEFYYKLGTVYMANGKWENAAAALNRVLKWNPKRTDVLSQVGIAYKAQKRLQQALETYFRLLSHHPGDPEIFYEIGAVYKEMGQNESALESYLKAENLARSGSDSLAKLDLAIAEVYYEIWSNKKKKTLLEMAKTYHEKVLATSPEHGKFRRQLEKIEKLLNGQIQVLMVTTRWHRKYQEITGQIKHKSSFGKLMEIAGKYPRQSQITFLHPQQLAGELKDALISLRDGEISPVVRHKNKYMGFYRITSSDGGRHQ